jgi:2-dehydropantoate 2-reductase
LGFDGFEPDAIASGVGLTASLDALIAVRRGDEKTHSGVWRDLAVRRRRTEVDAHFVPIVEKARRHGLETPMLERMIAMIHEIEDGSRAFSGDNIEALAGPVITR